MNEIEISLNAEIGEAVATARYFVATIWHGYAYHAHPLRTLIYARAVARILPAFLGSSRKAMVYAVIEEHGVERSVLVPDDWASPAEIAQLATSPE